MEVLVNSRNCSSIHRCRGLPLTLPHHSQQPHDITYLHIEYMFMASSLARDRNQHGEAQGIRRGAGSVGAGCFTEGATFIGTREVAGRVVKLGTYL
jgi:hypothetical protein